MNTQSFNMEFAPGSYFEDLTLEEKLRSKIKGQIRGEFVQKNIRNQPINPAVFQSELNQDLKSAQSAVHPWMMGGEYLPDLKLNETEICRIVLKSTTMDVTSMRARIDEGIIKYRVVDEYGETDYVLRFQQSDEPLKMSQLVDNIDQCVEIHKDSGDVNDYGGGGLVKPWVYQQFEFGDSLEEAVGFVTVHSAFYPDLERYYEHQKPVWFRGM
jgi:hypothetical protein